MSAAEDDLDRGHRAGCGRGGLGGEWQTTDTTLWGPPGTLSKRPVYSEYYTLFDHTLWFRRRGARGPSTRDNWVIVGCPYNTFDNEGLVQAESLGLAAYLTAQYRRDLSAWYPGWT